MFPTVAAAFVRGPKWALVHEATEEEQAEALRVFGVPHEAVGTAQVQITKTTDGRYHARGVSWDSGMVHGASYEEIADQISPWREQKQQAREASKR